MPSYSRSDTILLVAVAANVCAFLIGWTIVRNANVDLFGGLIRKVGDELPLLSSTDFLMAFEDANQIGALGEREWLESYPINDGYVHFGEDRRFFATAVAHEMHCVQMLKLVVDVPTHPKANSMHATHCLNYLRMYALCNADLTLEEFDPLEGNFTAGHFGETHVCRHWEDAYDVFEKNTKDWLDEGRELRTPD